jgi:hypothetical protein
MAYVQKTYSGEDEKAIKAELASRFQVAEAARRDDDEKNYGAARLEYEQTGRVKPSTMLLLPEGKRAELLRVMKADQKARATAGGVKTDWAVYEDLSARLARGENVNVAEYKDRLASGEMEKLIDRKTKGADPKKAPEVVTSEQQISASIQALEFKNERAGQYRGAAQDLFNEFLKKNKREPDFDERREILEGLTKDIVLKKRDWWFNSTGPAYTAPRDVRNAAVPLPSKFTAGQVYTDANGNRAKYLGDNKWGPAE